MTMEQVIALMQSATSEDDWNNKCDQVKAAHDGKYPDYWFRAIVQSGITRDIAESWS